LETWFWLVFVEIEVRVEGREGKIAVLKVGTEIVTVGGLVLS
jgi:hypothetical protein